MIEYDMAFALYATELDRIEAIAELVKQLRNLDEENLEAVDEICHELGLRYFETYEREYINNTIGWEAV